MLGSLSLLKYEPEGEADNSTLRSFLQTAVRVPCLRVLVLRHNDNCSLIVFDEGKRSWHSH